MAEKITDNLAWIPFSPSLAATTRDRPMLRSTTDDHDGIRFAIDSAWCETLPVSRQKSAIDP